MMSSLYVPSPRPGFGLTVNGRPLACPVTFPASSHTELSKLFHEELFEVLTQTERGVGCTFGLPTKSSVSAGSGTVIRTSA